MPSVLMRDQARAIACIAADPEALRRHLDALAEPDYARFSAALMPGATPPLGVRLPLLRRIAREIARTDWRAYLASARTASFEERMLQGMVIAAARCTPEERLRRTKEYLPLIDSWALCDCFCWRLRAGEREPMWAFIQPLFTSQEEYEVRFAATIANPNFIDEAHLDALLGRLGSIRHTGYYARMGCAWCVSVCYVKQPAKTRQWLAEACPLDDWTYNKALQKIIESRRVTPGEREEIRRMKRR